MASDLDSLGATELERALSKKLDVELPATLLFDYPSIDAAVCFIIPLLQTLVGGLKCKG